MAEREISDSSADLVSRGSKRDARDDSDEGRARGGEVRERLAYVFLRDGDKRSAEPITRVDSVSLTA